MDAGHVDGAPPEGEHRSGSIPIRDDEGRSMSSEPIIVFDVNETLLDLEAIRPTFDRIFETPRPCGCGSRV